MNQSAPARHPWKALAAIIAMAAVVHGVQAATADEEERAPTAHVHVIGHMPLHEACPAVDDELADDLVQAWNDADTPVTVPVQFKLRGGQVFDVMPSAESPRLYRQVRRAVRSLQCDSHDDQVHIVDMIVRFENRHGDSITHLAIDDRPQD
jgi:hypothetical protein